MEKLRVGLIGCGPRAVEHMEAVDVHAGLVMVAGADPAEKGRQRYSARYKTPVYADADEMLRNEKLDIVAICTREMPRHALAMAAIRAGVRGIALEKPMARTVDEAREMVAAARAKGITMVVSHQMRFADEFVAAREAVRRGDIGQVYYLRASSYGQLMEQGPHMVDMVLWLAGEPEVDWVMAAVADVAEGARTVHPAPAFVVGYIAFRNGVRAVVECGRRFQPALGIDPKVTWLQKRVQVLGTAGLVDAVVAHYAKILDTQGGWRTLYEGAEGWNRATVKFYAELYDVLTRGGVHRNNADVSLRGFEIIHAMFQSALWRDRVSPPLPPGAVPLEEIMRGLEKGA